METYTKLNSAPITGRTHTDTGLSAAAAGATYYYALSAVDTASDESVKSAAAAVTISASNSSSGGGGGGAGCFIAVAGWDLSPDLLKLLGAMALLICLGWRSGALRLEERAWRPLRVLPKCLQVRQG